MEKWSTGKKTYPVLQYSNNFKKGGLNETAHYNHILFTCFVGNYK